MRVDASLPSWVIASAEPCGLLDSMFMPHRSNREEAGVRAIGRGFRHARARHGLSQRSLAALSGVPQSTISRLETGSRTSIRVAHLARLVAIVGQITIDLDDR